MLIARTDDVRIQPYPYPAGIPQGTQTPGGTDIFVFDRFKCICADVRDAQGQRVPCNCGVATGNKFPVPLAPTGAPGSVGNVDGGGASVPWTVATVGDFVERATAPLGEWRGLVVVALILLAISKWGKGASAVPAV